MATDIQPRHFAFIINPRAGRRHDRTLLDRVIQLFSGNPHGHTSEFILTSQPGEATALAAGLAASHGGKLVAIACGGDGTANEVANGIAGTPAAMGILPIGTANDFARTALSGLDPDTLLRSLVQPEIRPIDVFRVDDRICLNITSLGFDTKVQLCASRINARFRWLGSLSYPLAILLTLPGGRKYDMSYRIQAIDGQGQTSSVAGDASFILAAICNGRYYGGGFNPAPQASIEDGRLDFCLIDTLPLRRILPLIPKYKQGRHLSDPAVHCWQVVSGSFEATAGLLLGNYDGETFAKKSIEFKIMPKALNFAFY